MKHAVAWSSGCSHSDLPHAARANLISVADGHTRPSHQDRKSTLAPLLEAKWSGILTADCGHKPSDEEAFRAGEPKGIEGVAVGQEKAQAGVGAVLLDPVQGLLDAGKYIWSFPDVMVEEGEVQLGVGVAENEA